MIRSRWWTPTRTVALGFLALIAVGTGLLMLPAATVGDTQTGMITALFTATSAVSLTGLTVTDTATYWSPLGHTVIAILVQVSGFGVMSMAALAGMIVTGRIGMRTRMLAITEARAQDVGRVTAMLRNTLFIMVGVEAVVAVWMALRLILGYDTPPLHALGSGLFHAISAFNNAGFALYPGNLTEFVGDGWVLAPLIVAIIVGGIGFPVLINLLRFARHRLKLTLTTKLTLAGTVILLGLGVVGITVLEWNNAFAELTVTEKLWAGLFQGVVPRTAGFNTVDYAAMHPVTLMFTNGLMFIGGGSAGTAGGIKVTTAMVLMAAMISEIRGRTVTTAFRTTVASPVIRQALTLTTASILAIGIGCWAIMLLEDTATTDQIAFETFSAFATVGLSTGITPQLTPVSQLILCLLMYAGRIGPFTLIAALAMGNRGPERFTYPEERPYIG